MNRSVIKIGSRLAVVILIYLLLSIPDSKYQNDLEELETTVSGSSTNHSKITKHVPWVIGLDGSQIENIYDSLNEQLTARLVSLKSEMLGPSEIILDSVNNELGVITALVGLSDIDPKLALNHLWQWKVFIKEQSLFWNINNGQNLKQVASILNFVGICEDFIVVNRKITYSKFNDRAVELLPNSIDVFLKSGDLLVSAYDASYPYLSLSKDGLEQTQSLALVLIKNDSSFFISTTPSQGLQINPLKNLSITPFSKRYILRLRGDLPELISNPTLSHQAATFAFDLATRRSANYDFNYNPDSRSSLYETELLALAYEGRNLDFSLSFTELLEDCRFGINRLGINFLNQGVASELQFHPAFDVIGQQLSGEEIWNRDLEMASALAGFKTAQSGNTKSLRWRLPYYRLLKAYGNIVGLFGWTGKIPSGMSSETAIIHDYALSQKWELLPLVEAKANDFYNTNHYLPTYAELCSLADEIANN